MSLCSKFEANDRSYNNIGWVFGNIERFSTYSYIVDDYLQPNYFDHSPIMLNVTSPIIPARKPFWLLTSLLQQIPFKDLRAWNLREENRGICYI